LRTAILNVDFAPGTPLDEAQIATQLGVSKTPLREAISRLTGEGLVVAKPGVVKYVADLPMEAIRDIYQMRIIIESAAIQLATNLLTEGDLNRLGQLIEEAEEAIEGEDLIKLVATTEEFHALPIRRVGNKYLMTVATELFDRVHRVWAALYRIEQRRDGGDLSHALSRKGLDNHRVVLDALVARDADRASALVKRSLQAYLDEIDTPEMEAALSELSYRP
jgi:DNA-binding GntR family transcriptional regulator